MENPQESREERRKNLRIYASFVEYCPARAASSKKTPAFTENISSSGICILVNEELKTDDFLSLAIYLFDGKEPLELTGKVVWVKPSTFLVAKDRNHYDVGIQFIEIDKNDQERLLKYTTRYADEKITP